MVVKQRCIRRQKIISINYVITESASSLHGSSDPSQSGLLCGLLKPEVTLLPDHIPCRSNLRWLGKSFPSHCRLSEGSRLQTFNGGCRNEPGMPPGLSTSSELPPLVGRRSSAATTATVNAPLTLPMTSQDCERRAKRCTQDETGGAAAAVAPSGRTAPWERRKTPQLAANVARRRIRPVVSGVRRHRLNPAGPSGSGQPAAAPPRTKQAR